MATTDSCCKPKIQCGSWDWTFVHILAADGSSCRFLDVRASFFDLKLKYEKDVQVYLEMFILSDVAEPPTWARWKKTSSFVQPFIHSNTLKWMKFIMWMKYSLNLNMRVKWTHLLPKDTTAKIFFLSSQTPRVLAHILCSKKYIDIYPSCNNQFKNTCDCLKHSKSNKRR